MSTQPRRALLVLPWLEMGGADMFNLDLTQQLVRRHGWHVTIALTLPGGHAWRPLFERYTRDIVPLHPLARPEAQPAFVRDLIRSRGIGAVLVSHSELGYALLPYLRAHCPGVALVDYLHIEEEHWRGGGYPRFSLDAAGWLDLTVVSSDHLRRWMLERGGRDSRIEVCTVNIDTAAWDPARYDRAALRASLGLGPSEPAVLFVGRLVPQKQPRLLAEVARRLERGGRRFALLVAGDGPERGWLEQFVRRERLSSVRLLGAVGEERVRELMAAADIFFLPSRHEGISLALFEAMAMGLPAVAADVGGQRELLAAECGLLVRSGAGEADRYADALASLLDRPELRAPMGLAARRHVCVHFRIEHMGERMAALLEQARSLAASSPAPVSPEAAAESRARAVAAARAALLSWRLWRRTGVAGGARWPGAGLLRRAKPLLYPVYRRMLGITK